MAKLAEIVDMLFDKLVEQVVFIRVMKIDGSPIYIGSVGNISDCNGIEIFFDHQFKNRFFDGLLRFKYPSVHLGHANGTLLSLIGNFS